MRPTLGQTLQNLQEQMAERRKEIAALKRPSSPLPATPTPSLARLGRRNTYHQHRFPECPGQRRWTSDNNNTPKADMTCFEEARVAEVSEATQELLK